jgi:hypothetical protein
MNCESLLKEPGKEIQRKRQVADLYILRRKKNEK